MDEGGTAFSILSLNSPGIQGIPNVQEAIDVSRRANDVLAEHISRHPAKLGGFAALPMQDAEAAARELERCIKTLGFHGFMVNGFSQVGAAVTTRRNSSTFGRAQMRSASHFICIHGIRCLPGNRFSTVSRG
jgi:2,3-dihydroxybenzoate decarboxylase